MTQMETDPWVALENEPVRPGRARRRIRPTSDRDLFVELDLDTRQRIFAYRRPWPVQRPAPQSTRTEALDCSFRIDPSGETLEMTLTLHDAALAQVFTPMVLDLAETLAAATSDDNALGDLLARLAEWQLLFESIRREGLSPAARRGLVGELLILRDDVIPQIGPEAAIAGWTGPLRSNQDFQLSTTALEVKATGSLHPQGFTVNNERELDITGTDASHLSLAHVSLDERQGQGLLIGELIDDIDERLTKLPAARAQFHDLLGRTGYLAIQQDLYTEPHYSVRGIRYFDVSRDFPRITESELRDGVGQVEYRVTLAACTDYEMTRQDVLDRIAGVITND